MGVSAVSFPIYRSYGWGNFPYNVTSRSLQYDPYVVSAYTIRSPNAFYNFTLQSPLDAKGNETAITTYYSLDENGRTVAVSQPNAQAYAKKFPYAFRINAEKLMNPYDTNPLLTTYTPADSPYNTTPRRYQTQVQFFDTSSAKLQAYLDENPSFYLPYLRLEVTQKGLGYTVIKNADGTFSLTSTAADGGERIRVVNTPQSILSRFLDESIAISPDIFALIELASEPLNVPDFGNSSLEIETTSPTESTDATQVPPPPRPLITAIDVAQTPIPLSQILPTETSSNKTDKTTPPPPQLVLPFPSVGNASQINQASRGATFFKTDEPVVSPSFSIGAIRSSEPNTSSPAIEALRLQDFRRPFAFPLPTTEAVPLSQETAFSGKTMDFTQFPASFGNMANLGEHQELNRQRATGEPTIARQFRIRRLRQAIKTLK
jgi:hypothetical protein